MPVLPPDASKLLIEAGLKVNPVEKRIAVDAAIDTIKQKYPTFFNLEEQDHEINKRKTSIPRFVRSENRKR